MPESEGNDKDYKNMEKEEISPLMEVPGNIFQECVALEICYKISTSSEKCIIGRLA